jgi:hypothetical protein
LEEIDLGKFTKLQTSISQTDLSLQSANTAMVGMTPGNDGKKEEDEFEWLHQYH